MKPNGKPNGKADLPELVPQPHGGALYRGGVPGNKGGPGRPRAQLRKRMRELLYMSQADINKRLRAERRRLRADEYQVAALKKRTKKQLLEMIENGQLAPPPAIDFDELRQLMDVAARYGIGSKNVLEVEADDDGQGHGIVLLPAVQRRADA